jgi:HSP20 family protein
MENLRRIEMIRFQNRPITARFAIEDSGRPVTPADITEDGDNFYLTLELPGVTRDNVRIWVEDSVLAINGEKKDSLAEKDVRRLSERRFGKFEKSFRLPRLVDVSRIEADFKDGILTITVPKSAEAKPKDIKIN